MTKFGNLISVDIPVLIHFYQNNSNAETNLMVLKQLSSAIGDKAKIIKIEVAKNELLADALKIKGHTTYVIYKDGEMKWRQSGEITSEILLQTLEQFM
ncbi:MAG: thioredoxin family protein [Flavobacteriaceae bacterium]|jgi:thioredoxin 1|nr:thioredoxin family protein [Flavobacteriaceae bacterium]